MEFTDWRFSKSVMVLILTVMLFSTFVLFSSPAISDSHSVKNRAYSPPEKPILLLPPNGTTGLVGGYVVLTWEGVEQTRSRQGHYSIDNFSLKVSTVGPVNSDASTGNIFDSHVGNVTSYYISVTDGTKYYWSVKAHDTDGWGPWSDSFEFSTNTRPIANISSIIPSTPRAGETVRLEGDATDPDGDLITLYSWSSDRDGRRD